MATKYLFRIAAIAATLLAAAACIYPYEVELDQASELPLVVEGDIHIGGVTTVQLSHVRPFNIDENETTFVIADGFIEGEDGTRVLPDNPYIDYYAEYLDRTGMVRGEYGIPSSRLTFQTEDLPASQRYRLFLQTYDPQTGRATNTFESDWLTPCPAPTIEELTYSQQPEYDELWVGLSMHCHGSHYFRWTFSETWEYHSDINTWYEYKPALRDVGRYEGATLYYCWKSEESGQINIFSTVNQTEDRFEELAFHRISLSDKRLQVLYRIKVRLEALSEDAYNYWYNMQQNSEGQGSIFSPTPSEMASNIRCTSDPTVQVMGYLNAAVQTEALMYYDNQKNGFYKPDKPFERFDTKVSVHQQDSMAYWYARGFLPYDPVYEEMSPNPSHYMWATSICIDCRKQGGTKNKPADWPNGDR